MEEYDYKEIFADIRFSAQEKLNLEAEYKALLSEGWECYESKKLSKSSFVRKLRRLKVQS